MDAGTHNQPYAHTRNPGPNDAPPDKMRVVPEPAGSLRGTVCSATAGEPRQLPLSKVSTSAMVQSDESSSNGKADQSYAFEEGYENSQVDVRGTLKVEQAVREL